MSIKDPRVDSYALLVTLDEELEGEWHLQHIGYGIQVFIDAKTGDIVPLSSVIKACRERRNRL